MNMATSFLSKVQLVPKLVGLLLVFAVVPLGAVAYIAFVATKDIAQPVWATTTVKLRPGMQNGGAVNPPGDGTTTEWMQPGAGAPTSCRIAPPDGNGNGESPSTMRVPPGICERM